MKLPEKIFQTRVWLGRPFSRCTQRHKPVLDSAQLKATREVIGLDAVFPKYDPTVLQQEIDRLAIYLAITGLNANYAHGHLLAAAIEYLVNDRAIESPSILEIGTAKGFGSMVMSLALTTYGNSSPKQGKTQIHTIDFLPHDKPFYWGTYADLCLGKVTRKDLWHEIGQGLEETIKFTQITSERFTSNQPHASQNHYDLVFIDGGHDYHSVLRELRFADTCGSAIIVVDDCNAKFPGVVQAVDQFSFESDTYARFDLSSSAVRKYAVFIYKP